MGWTFGEKGGLFKVAYVPYQDLFTLLEEPEYGDLSRLHPEGPVRDLLARMANEELRHKEKVEYLYANTAFPQTSGG